MKLKFIFLIIILFTVFCCTKNKSKLTEIDKEYLNKKVDSIFELDQKVRLYFNTIDDKFKVNRNTFSKSEGFKRQYLDSLTYPMYKKSVDSIWGVLKINDSLNTNLLITLTKEYGFPNNRRLGVLRSKAYTIFAHTPKYYFTEVKDLVIEEYNAGRLIEFKKEYILWHINGRKTPPPMAGTKGEAIWQESLERENR